MHPNRGKQLKVLFFNVPLHGHVNPSLDLVAELTKRGHSVVLYLLVLP